MPFTGKGIFRVLLAIPPEATRFSTHGFHVGTSDTREQLERSAATFVLGYHTALASSTNGELAQQLEQVEPNFKGFAYEGAAMALGLLDFFFPRNRRFLPFTQEEGNDHIYMLYVGWGWTMGRLPRKQIKATAHSPYDPLLRWLAYDGYGFHEGFFSWQRTFIQQRQPSSLPAGYACRAFDQGLGRGLWFVGCGDVSYIAECIGAFPRSRQADLWSGIGLACTYAGGVSEATIRQLYQAALPFYPQLAQGAAFAVKARQRAGNLGPYTKLACDILCQQSIDNVASIANSSLENLPPDNEEPAFEIWRRRIQMALRPSVQAH